MSKNPSSPLVFIGRQPIYNRDLTIHGYELLYRCDERNCANVVDGDLATTEVIVNALLEIGLDKIVGYLPAFFNFTRRFILEQRHYPLPPGQLVIEVLEDVPADPEILEALRELSRRGHRIALDDFIPSAAARSLLDLADIVKIDIRQHSVQELKGIVDQVKHLPLQLLAEKVETLEEFEICRDLGFDLFQGYFLSRPNVIRERNLAAHRLSTLRLLGQLQSPHVEIDELEETIRRDIGLSFKLLRSVNSVYFGLRQRVSSIRHAIVLLGLQHIRNWATVVAMSNLDEKPVALLGTSLIRARMCERLVGDKDTERQGLFFIVGLFSVLDALFDRPLEEILYQLPLAQEICDALLHHKGEAGGTLQTVIAYEKGDWDAIGESQFEPQILTQAYLDAIQWADSALQWILSTKDEGEALK